jgi:hypothetical protein
MSVLTNSVNPDKRDILPSTAFQKVPAKLGLEEIGSNQALMF